ncbi:MAG: hypothetical protein ACR2PO_15560, partial [Methyloligellaceae bacterium]
GHESSEAVTTTPAPETLKVYRQPSCWSCLKTKEAVFQRLAIQGGLVCPWPIQVIVGSVS